MPNKKRRNFLSKIAKYGVVEDVIHLRESGLSYREIVEDINSSGKVPEDDPISIDNVSNFLENVQKVKRNIYHKSEGRIIKAIDKSFDIIYEVDNLFQRTKNLLGQMENDAEERGKYVNPYQYKAVCSEMRELLSQMIEIQKEVNDYKNVQKFMEVILETLEEEVPDKIPIIVNKLKGIKETKWFSDILNNRGEN